MHAEGMHYYAIDRKEDITNCGTKRRNQCDLETALKIRCLPCGAHGNDRKCVHGEARQESEEIYDRVDQLLPFPKRPIFDLMIINDNHLFRQLAS